MKLLSIILISFALVISCTKDSSKKRQNDNIARIPLSGEISSLDPASVYDTLSGHIIYQVYEQLYEYHYLKRPYTLVPLLADGMPIIENDGKKYTIKIKKNVQYHQNMKAFGEEVRFLKAEDFVTQIKRLAYIPTKSNGWWLFDGKIKGINKWRDEVGSDFQKFLSTPIEGIYAPDDHTLVFELNEPFPQMLYSLTMSFTSPVPIEMVKKLDNNLNEKMVGTGPFILDSYNPYSEVKLSRFTNYHESFYPDQGDRLAHSMGFLEDAGKKIPFLDGIHFQIIRESQTRWLNFRSRNIDILVVPKDNFDTAIDISGNLSKQLKDESIQLQIYPTLTYWWLSFNMRDPILGKNLNLRKAIAHAVDMERYINLLTNNTGQKANSIYPPGIPGYDPARKLPYEYNLEKAKNYLKQAGFPEGKGLPELTYDVRGVTTTHRQQGEFIKAELEKIGIRVNVRINNFPAFLEKARSGQLQIWLDGWAMDYPDAENILQLLITKNHPPGPNVTYYSNPKFDELFDKLKPMTDQNEKRKLMIEMEDIVNQDLPWVMHYYARNYILYHNYLRNYRHSDLIYNNLKYLKIQR